MSAPTIVGTPSSQGSTGSFSLVLPTGWQVGDLLVIVAETANQNLSTPSFNWNLHSSTPVDNAANTRLYVFWKVAVADEINVLITSPGDHVTAGIFCIRGQETFGGNPFGAVQVSTGSGATITHPAITTTQANSLVLLCSATGRDGNSTAQFGLPVNGNLTGITELLDRTVNAGGGGGIQAAYGIKASTGSTGTSSTTQATTDGWAVATIEIKAFVPRLVASAASFSVTGQSANLTTTAQLPPTIVGVGDLASGVGNGYVVTPFPTGVQERDLLICLMETADQIGYVRSDISSGWTQLTGSPVSNSGQTRITAYWKVATPSDISSSFGCPVQVNNGAPDHIVSRVVVVRGWNTAHNNWQGGLQGTTGSGTSISLTGLTTTGTNELIIAAVATAVDATGTAQFSAWANTDLGGLTEIADGTNNTGNGGGLGIASGLKGSAGAFGNSTVTQATADSFAGLVIAIKPPPRGNQHLDKGTFSVSGSAKLVASKKQTRPWLVRNYINFEEVYAVESYTDDSSYNLPIVVPPWAQEGDLLIAFIAHKNHTIGPTLSGTGWTQVSNSPIQAHFNEDFDGAIYYKRCDVNEPNPTFAASALTRYGYILAVRDAPVRGVPFHTVSKGGSGQGSLTNAPVGTTTINDALLIVAHLVSRGGVSISFGNSNPNIDSGGFPASVVNPTANMDDTHGTNARFNWATFVTQYDGKTTAGAGGNIQNSISDFLDVTSWVGSIVTSQTHVLDAHIGQFNVSGKEATLSKELPGPDPLIGGLGNFTHSGAAALMFAHRKLQADQASLSHSGIDAALIASRHLTGDDGDYSVNGQNATLTTHRRLIADAGIFTHTGQDASLFYLEQGDYIMAGGIGSFSNTGVNANLRVNRLPLVAGQGTYTLDPEDAVLLRTIAPLIANGGIFSLVGLDALLKVAKNMEAELGVFSLTGLPAFFSNVHSAGQFTFTGIDVTFKKTYKLTAEPGIFEVTSGYTILQASKKPSFQIRCIVDLYPVISSPVDHEHGGRLTVGGTEIPIKEWTFEEPDNEPVGVLNVTLARNNDRTLLTKDANLKFESVKMEAGVEVWETLFELGRIGSYTYTQQTNEDNVPENVVQFVGNPPMKAMLDIAPLDNEVFYDPDTHDLNIADFDTIPDSEGGTIITNLHSMPHLDLYKLFNEVFIGICGFAAVETNLPNIRLNRLDIPPGQSAYDAVMSLIPMYNPDPSVVGNTMWVRDGTSLYSEGMPAPRQLQNTYLSNSAISTEYKRLRGIMIQYAQKGLEYDNFIIEIQSSDNFYGIGSFSSSIQFERYIVKFFKSTRPDIIVKEVLLREERRYYDNGELIKIVVDNYRVDTWGRTLGRQSFLEMKYLSADTYAFGRVLIENEVYVFSPHRYKADNYYTRLHYIHTEGMVYVDSVNTQGGEQFTRGVMDTIRSGNYLPELTESWQSIKTYREEQIPLSKNKVFILTTEQDHISGYVHQEIQSEKAGDIGLSMFSMIQKELFVPSKNPDPQATAIETINMGELSVDEGINLADRLIYISNELPNRADINWIGIDTTLTKGTPFEAYDEDGLPLGTYIVEGRSLSGSLESGFFTKLNGRQIR